ncbi:hypothetical protein B0J17DRAFT_629131 [Rhizoctonia solani]|nr:hypothetical protein B0J17DRAFT_629131 [Rhizoctonia solani]
MKYRIFIYIALITQLAPTSAALLTVLKDRDSSASLVKSNAADPFGDRNVKTLNAAARELKNTHGMTQVFYNVVPVCAEHDCRNNIFMNEALRWVKQALKDVVEVLSGGIIIPLALDAIEFGTKGPIKDSIAAAMQSKINPLQLGSMFSKLQSAAMGGAIISELQNIARIAVAGLIAVGALAIRSFGGAPTFEGGMDPHAVCLRTPASINGVGYETPLDCVDRGSKEGVVATWYVPTNGTRCMPQWSIFENEGCMLYGRRRKFARMMGLKNNDDWKSVCQSTPAIIDSKHYDAPFYCEDKCSHNAFSLRHGWYLWNI